MPAAGCRRCHRPAQVAMHQFQLLLRALLGLGGEGCTPLLGDDAGVAEMAVVLDHRHPAHYVLLVQLVQGVEVEVAVAFMPKTRLIILARGEAELLALGTTWEYNN